MSNKIGFARGLSYVGTNADQPPNWAFEQRDPTQYDTNFSLGDIWLNTVTQGKWVLTSLQGTNVSKGELATWTPWGATGNGIISITGTDGIQVPGDINNRVYFATTISGLTMTSGAPGAPNTVVFGAAGGGNLVTKLQGDAGAAVTADAAHTIHIESTIPALSFTSVGAPANTINLEFTGIGPFALVRSLSGDTSTPVFPDVNGDIGIISNISNLTVLEDVVGNQLSLESSTGNSFLETITGNVGGAVSGDAGGNINIVGDGVTVNATGNPGTNTITISSSVTGYVWMQVAGAAQALVHAHGYIANNALQTIFTLPVMANIGDSFVVTGMNNDTGWSIAQNAGQTIFFGEVSTTMGVGGSLNSTKTRDTVFIVCTNTNTQFTVVASIGNILVV